MADDRSPSVLEPAHFEALYRGEEVDVSGMHLPRAPWQLDEPQPIVREIAAAGLTGPVLECGCGAGDNALELAAQGHRVTAFDAADGAIEQSRAKAVRRGLDVEFLVADATVLDGVPSGFGSVLDSALLHCLTRPQRRDYLAAVHRVCAPGARLHVLCFDEQVPDAWPIPDGLDEASLRADLEPAWRIESIGRRRYTTGMTRDLWRTVMTPAVGSYPADLDGPDAVDEQGRVLLPIWQISAVRA